MARTQSEEGAGSGWQVNGKSGSVGGGCRQWGGVRGAVGGTSRQWRAESVGGRGSVRGREQCQEGAISGEDWPLKGWISGRIVGKSVTMTGDSGTEKMMVQWKEGEAMGHVVILLFYPPN